LKKSEPFEETEQRIREFQLNWGTEESYDLWHLHVDFYGRGNASIQERRRYISLALKLLDQINEQATNYPKPWQSWVCIIPDDSAQDGVYFHTPNRIHDNFPIDFSYVQWDAIAPDLFRDLVPSETYQTGEAVFEGNSYYIIRRI